MKKLAIIGAGDLGQQIAHHAKECGYEVVGFFDDFQANGLGRLAEVGNVFNRGLFDELMIGIGYKHMKVRAQLFQQFQGTIPFARIIHPSSNIDPSCILGEGTFVYPGCTLDMNVVVGNNVSLNVGCTIAHDSIIGDHSMLSPGVVISGFVKIKQQTNLGTGTQVIDNIEISTGVRTGAGAVVTGHLLERGLYVGVPAKFKKE